MMSSTEWNRTYADLETRVSVKTSDFPIAECICVPDHEDMNGGLRDDCPTHGDPAIINPQPRLT